MVKWGQGEERVNWPPQSTTQGNMKAAYSAIKSPDKVKSTNQSKGKSRLDGTHFHPCSLACGRDMDATVFGC